MQLEKVGSFLGQKQPGHKVKHQTPSNAEVKNKWSYASIPPICLHGTDRRNFTITWDVTPCLIGKHIQMSRRTVVPLSV